MATDLGNCVQDSLTRTSSFSLKNMGEVRKADSKLNIRLNILRFRFFFLLESNPGTHSKKFFLPLRTPLMLERCRCKWIRDERPTSELSAPLTGGR